MIDRARWFILNALASGRGPLILALCLVLACLGASLDAWRSSRAARLAEAELVDETSHPAPAPPSAKASDDVDAFLRKLPPAIEWPRQVKALFDLADESGVTLDRGEYDSSMPPSSLIRRLHITLPVKGDPARIANFAAAIYAQIPAMAIESISIKRESGAASLVEAKLGIDLFLDARTPR